MASPVLFSNHAPFADALEHLLAELERIDLLIQVSVNRARRQQKKDEFQGLYISEQEVDDLLTRSAGLPRWAGHPLEEDELRVHDVCASRAAEIEGRAIESDSRNIWLPLLALERRFGLTRFDMDIVMVCAALEVDTRYERLYAYLQDDITRKRPSVDLVLNLLCPEFRRKIEERSRFAPGSPLLANQIIMLIDDQGQARTPLPFRSVQLDERIVAYILGRDHLDARLIDSAFVSEPTNHLSKLVLPDQFASRIFALAEIARKDCRMTLYLQGPDGVGKRGLAEALCCELGVGLLRTDLDAAVTGTPADFKLWLRLVLREATLRSAALYFSGFDPLLRDEQRLARGVFVQELQKHSGFVVIGGEGLWEPGEFPPGLVFVRLEMPIPDYAERLALWKGTTSERKDNPAPGNAVPQEWLQDIAAKFRLTGGQIRNAAAGASQLALSRRPQNSQFVFADFQEACRLHSNRNLAALARRVVPRYRWKDIVLPDDRIEQLKEICSTLEHRPTVHGKWGFDEKLSLGKGLNVLFAGPSGTGKTMAAEVLACELGLELYKTDLSFIVSKYIGETEKNLSRIFAEAASSNAILFFDEADALFGKRSEVRDSHDRYANIEVNFLLQEMERYEGMAILATNLRKNMDESFVRRMRFLIEFPFPGAEDRLRIWQGAFPMETPLSLDLDLDFMACSFEMSGGNLKNIALGAAFLAATRGGVVSMADLMLATRREYQKMGKILSGGEFGKYAGLIGME